MGTIKACELEVERPLPMKPDVTECSNEQQEQLESAVPCHQQVLALRAQQGDEEAFEDILDTYKGLMLHIAHGIVKDRDIAEDAVQDALILAWQHLPNLRETRALRPWLLRIVVNQCISFKRRVARSTMFLQQSFLEQETEQASQIASYAEGHMERNWDLAQAIGKLPVKQRTAIALHYYQGMTLPEMSRTLHISENTLKKRIQMALSNLRNSINNNQAILSPDHL